MTTAQLRLGEITVEVTKKDIKNVHLSVRPPSGSVTIAAPRRMKLETIRLFAISKLPWIREKRRKLAAQTREPSRDYIDRESHYLWGKRYLLKLVAAEGAPSLHRKHRTIELRAAPTLSPEARAQALSAWYRNQIREAIVPVLAKWQPILGVQPNRIFVQHMKTKWGSCNPQRRNIRLNTELAKKSPECLEYVVVHELLHLVVRRHNDQFVSLLDRHLPHWRSIRSTLNEQPVPICPTTNPPTTE